MIWFFLTGMIGGAVGTWMLVLWWVKTHTREVTFEELKKELDRTKNIPGEGKEEKKE